MERDEIVLKKIPVEILLETLHDLYHRGVAYIDIMGIAGQEQDTLGISFNSEYMRENIDFEDVDEIININLSDEDDLNQIV